MTRQASAKYHKKSEEKIQKSSDWYQNRTEEEKKAKIWS